MADLLGENSNLVDEIFEKLENWETLLSSLEELPFQCSDDIPKLKSK